MCVFQNPFSTRATAHAIRAMFTMNKQIYSTYDAMLFFSRSIFNLNVLFSIKDDVFFFIKLFRNHFNYDKEKLFLSLRLWGIIMHHHSLHCTTAYYYYLSTGFRRFIIKHVDKHSTLQIILKTIYIENEFL